jgi:protein-S-isoprenylcysteine O-methyltransferase Ste14
MSDDTRKLNIHGKRGIINIFSWLIFSVLLLFGSAGTLYWVRGWIYICQQFSFYIIYILILMIVNPQLLNERGKYNWKETKRYDKYFVISYYIFGPSMLIVAGLDVRFQWSSIPFIAIYPSLIAIILTSGIALWAHISNSHFLLTSRNDMLGNQRVCTTGPYKYIRHPGYLCAVIQWFCYPFVLGSLFSFIPALIYMSFWIIRTYYEDKTLKIELKGYEEYSRTTKYRLFPYLW